MMSVVPTGPPESSPGRPVSSDKIPNHTNRGSCHSDKNDNIVITKIFSIRRSQGVRTLYTNIAERRILWIEL